MTNQPSKRKIIFCALEGTQELDLSSSLDPVDVELVIHPALSFISRLIRDTYGSITNNYYVAGVSGRCFPTGICYRILHHGDPFRQSHQVVIANGEWSGHDLNQILLGEGPSESGGGSAGLPDYLVVLLPISNLNALPSYRNWNGVIERAFRLCLTSAAALQNAEQQVHRQRTPESRLRCALPIEQFWAMFRPRRPSS